jgi:hypothetical protein
VLERSERDERDGEKVEKVEWRRGEMIKVMAIW